MSLVNCFLLSSAAVSAALTNEKKNLMIFSCSVVCRAVGANTKNIQPYHQYQSVRYAKTLADTVAKYKHDFRPEAGINRVLQEEDVNDMRKRSIEILKDPLSSISLRESRHQQVTIPKSDRTPVLELYWRCIGKYRHQSVVGRRLLALCLERVDCKALRDLFHLNDGFNHRFFFLILHVWILHQRLTLEGWMGEMADDQLFTFLSMLIFDWLYLKNTPTHRVSSENNYCLAFMYGFCLALDQSLQYIDILPARIHEVLWLHLYAADVNPDEEYLDCLTKYTLRQWTHVLQLERNHILEGMFAWASFPVPGMPRVKAIPPFSQDFQEFGYSPRAWDKLKNRFKIVHKRTEMVCLKDYCGWR